MISTTLDRVIGEPTGTYLATRSGTCLRVRPVKPTDAPMVAQFISRLSPEDLRFRFLDTRKLPQPDEIVAMLEVDHRRSEHLLAFDTHTGELIASLMLIADPAMRTCEIAIAVRGDWKDHGIGWALLRHARELASSRGIRTLQSIESRANHDALEVERAQGFHVRDLPGDPGLVMVEAQLD